MDRHYAAVSKDYLKLAIETLLPNSWAFSGVLLGLRSVLEVGVWRKLTVTLFITQSVCEIRIAYIIIKIYFFPIIGKVKIPGMTWLCEGFGFG